MRVRRSPSPKKTVSVRSARPTRRYARDNVGKHRAELIERCCAHARRFAEALAEAPDIEVLNEVVLNQVLVRFTDQGGDHDRYTRAVIQAVQNDGTCWLGGTSWHGMEAMRISVSNWSTTSEDVERSIEAIFRAAADAKSLAR